MKYLQLLAFFLVACVPVNAVSTSVNLESIYERVSNEHNFGNPVVLTGDSLIHRMEWNYLMRDVLGYSDVPTLFNRGIGGNTTADLKRRFKTNVLDLNPSKIFILIGTNDFTRVNANNYVNLANTAYNNISDMVAMTDVPIYIISVLPVINQEGYRNTVINLLNSKLQSMQGITYIDVASHIKTEHFIGYGTAHINDAGYMVFGEILKGYL